MNDADSKKLEEIAEILRQELKKNIPQVVLNKKTLTDIAESIQGLYVPFEIRLAEQDREIAGLREALEGEQKHALLERKLGMKAEAKVAEQDREIERLRKELSRTWEGMWKERAEKAEAELEAQLITYQAKIKEIDALEAEKEKV